MNSASRPSSSCAPPEAVATRKFAFTKNDDRLNLPQGIERFFGCIETYEAAGMLPEDKSVTADVPLKCGLDAVGTVVAFLMRFKTNNADWEDKVQIDNEAILPRNEPWAVDFFEMLHPNDILRAINVASLLQAPVFMHYSCAFVARQILTMTIPQIRAYLHTRDNMTEEQWQQLSKESVFTAILKQDGAS